ncbi:hypothetical protein [Silicimonas algicola]|uniref:hypothetical protein n=1 Tax=Silicimonas algicola TaxID=1826607 RepID=UPI000D6ABC5A|nr:hypothetical protein [Silicimonas algicola]
MRAWLESNGRSQVIRTRFEEHVCVMQCAATLARDGIQVFRAAHASPPGDPWTAKSLWRGCGPAVWAS